MKRQADGVSCVPDESVEQAETNGSKRIKLINNKTSEEHLQVDDTEGKSVMDISLNESSHNHDHGNHSPSVSKNGSSNEHEDVPFEKDVIENHPSQNINVNESSENGSLNHIGNSNCNGLNEEVVKASANDASVVSELYYSNSHTDSDLCLEENHLFNEEEQHPPVLNHCDHDLQNSESTDSFQSEGFEANNCTRESNNVVSEAHASQEQDRDQEKKSSFEFNIKKSDIDVDNIMLSHLKVTELQGHTDVIFSVAADEDFILSASADTTVRVWNMERQTAVSTFSGHSDSITSLILLNPNQSKILKKKMSFTKVSRIAITGSLDCHIKLWSVLEGKELASLYTFNGITCLGYLESEGLVIVGTEGGKLELWNISSAKAVISLRAHDDAVTDIKVKDNYIYSVSVDGTVKVWAYEDDDIYPVYTRKRKEISSDKTGFKPAQWKTVAVADNVMYLGDNTNNIKVLDWRVGHLSLFRNQIEDQGVCDCVVAEKNMLFSTWYDSSTDAGGINVWKLPEMAYVCTFSGSVPYTSSLAVVQKDTRLKVVSGGHKLTVWEFDFCKPPSPQEEYCVRELESLGIEINENSVEIKNAENNKSVTTNSDESSSSKRWCSIM